MNTLVVDNKQLAINALVKILISVDPAGNHVGVNTAVRALEFVKEHDIDVVFLDIEMPGMNGLELAKRIKDICGTINIIFVTGYAEYALSAHQLYVSGFLLKPVTEEDVRTALDNLRYPIQERDSAEHWGETREQQSKLLTVRCFGNFEVFWDGIPLHFQRSKSKELLAYLIDRRGASCTIGELIGILWEDKSETRSLRSQCRNLIYDLRKTFQKNGIKDILIRSRNSVAIDCHMLDCDYYRFLNHDAAAVNKYRGEYMAQYSWAEMTTANLGNMG